jgi:hypothetical protein
VQDCRELTLTAAKRTRFVTRFRGAVFARVHVAGAHMRDPLEGHRRNSWLGLPLSEVATEDDNHCQTP